MKKLYWITIAGVAALITAYLFYTDDEGYPKSHDSILLIASMFCFYTGLITAGLAGFSYWWMIPALKRRRGN